MTRALNLTFGLVTLALGLGILAWVGYNLFVERQPEAEGRSPLAAVVFSGAAVYAGARRLYCALRGSAVTSVSERSSE